MHKPMDSRLNFVAGIFALMVMAGLAAPLAAQPVAATQPVMTSAPAPAPASAPAAGVLRADEFVLQDAEAIVRLTPYGAGILSADLTSYNDRITDAPKPPLSNFYPLLSPIGGPGGLVSLATESVTIDGLKDAPVTARLGTFSEVGPVTTAPDGSQSISFSERITAGGKPVLKLVRRYTLQTPKALGLDEKESKNLAGAATILVEQDLVNLGDKPLRVSFSFFGPTGLRAEDPRGDIIQVYAGQKRPDGVVFLPVPRGRPQAITYGWPFSAGTAASMGDDTGENKLVWLANANKYFVAVLAPLAPGTTFRTDSIKHGSDAATMEPTGDIASRWVTVPVNVPPDQTQTLKWELFLAPRTDSALTVLARHRDAGYQKLKDVDLNLCGISCLTPVLVPINYILQLIMFAGHWLTHDFGIAIIILVILVRVILHPLTKWGQIHMLRFSHALKQMAPKLKLVQEKYKDDKAAQAQAMQALYTEAKVSPAGPMLGCLPMFVQLPIWAALYYGINHTIELRHQPFWPVYWFTSWLFPNFMADLSAPDRLLWWGGDFQIPFIGSLFMLGPIQSLNILPFGLGFFMYVNQKLMAPASTPGSTPEQERVNKMMMNIMPWFFALMMYNMPSGLTLYIMTSMALSVVEQKRIRQHFYELHPEADPKNNPPEGGATALDGSAVAGTLIEKEDYTDSWRARDAAKRRKK